MPRQGLNCTLSYSDGTAVRGYRVRCSELSHGFEMIADESQSRTDRAFYPHKTAPTQFSIVVDLIGQRERQSLNAYLMGYVNYILDPGLKARITPQMTVRVPSRNFKRVGVPVSGFEFGTVLGEMLFRPRLVFETSGEPLDWDERITISRAHTALAASRTPETEFFYPTGTQLKGGESPEARGFQSIQGAVNGTEPLRPSGGGGTAPEII